MSYILSGVSIFTDEDRYKNPDYHPLSNIQHQRENATTSQSILVTVSQGHGDRL